MEPLRILLVVEQPLFLQGIRFTLQHLSGCAIVGASTDPDEILACVYRDTPDVVLIDAGPGSRYAPHLTRQIHQRAPRVALLILTPSEEEEQLLPFISAGAAACTSRAIAPKTLQETVRRVGRGEYLISSELLVRLQQGGHLLTAPNTLAVEDEGGRARSLSAPLSRREVELLEYVAQGKSNKEIGHALHISAQTVKNHVTSILKKLAVNDRTAAVVYALRQGWIRWHDG
jgi:DNA-binding NarL/FixJ family response regulator